MKRVLYFCLGLMGFLSLLCSVSAACVTNGNLMLQGFSQYSQTAHLDVSPARYGDYAHAIAAYLDGKAAAVQVPDPEAGDQLSDACSEKENRHLMDVRAIVSFLKGARWIGGGGVILVLAALYCHGRHQKELFLRDAVRGFAGAAGAIVCAALILLTWGLINFDGLFVTFHKIAFTNDLWLLNPRTDLLVALMPLPFFTWYAGELLKSLLPLLLVMLLTVIAYFKTKEPAP